MFLSGVRLDFDVFLDAELGQGLFDAQGCEARRSVSVPALAHDLSHHTQRLRNKRVKTQSEEGKKKYDVCNAIIHMTLE